MVGPGGFEPPTSPLSGARSSRLSYEPFPLRIGNCGLNGVQPCRNGGLPSKVQSETRNPQFKEVGSQSEPWQSGSALTISDPFRRRFQVLPRKEVIQPQVPLRLPCYDLVPVTDLTFGTTESWRLRALPASMT